jgi:hypothetical protein
VRLDVREIDGGIAIVLLGAAATASSGVSAGRAEVSSAGT